MNFNVTTVFTPLERQQLKSSFYAQKRHELVMSKVDKQAKQNAYVNNVFRTKVTVRSNKTITPPTEQAEPVPDPSYPPGPTSTTCTTCPTSTTCTTCTTCTTSQSPETQEEPSHPPPGVYSGSEDPVACRG